MECVLMYLHIFLVLISNIVNIDSTDSHKQKLSGVLNKFKESKGVLRPQRLESVYVAVRST